MELMSVWRPAEGLKLDLTLHQELLKKAAHGLARRAREILVAEAHILIGIHPAEQLARKVGGPPTERGEGATQSPIGANIAAALSSLDRGPANGPRVADEMDQVEMSTQRPPEAKRRGCQAPCRLR